MKIKITASSFLLASCHYYIQSRAYVSGDPQSDPSCVPIIPKLSFSSLRAVPNVTAFVCEKKKDSYLDCVKTSQKIDFKANVHTSSSKSVK